MLQTITLSCPLDELSLGLKTTAEKSGDISRDAIPGGHLHLTTGTLTCSNGHQWTIGNVEMERLA
jgi:hypothetical protein